jgi:hypothetical protein
MLNYITQHKFHAHLMAFLLMLISSAGMILLMQSERVVFIWLFIVIFAAANILAVFVK